MLLDGRISRFHTEANNLVSIFSIFIWLAYSPTYIIRKLLKLGRPARPWWPVNCISEVTKLIDKESLVLEFGSGSSSFWLASKVKHITSIEDDFYWFSKVRDMVDSSEVSNLTLVYGKDFDYHSPKNIDFSSFDFFVVDGNYRWLCIENIISHMKIGSIVYLDNSDSDKDKRFYANSNDSKKAQGLIKSCVEKGGFRSWELHGMIDGEFFGGSGLFLQRMI